MLSGNNHSLDHSNTASMSACNSSLLSIQLIALNNFKSSAYNIATAVRITSGRSLMNITNKSGLSTLPYITPLGTLTIFDLADPMFANCCLSRKKSDIQFKTNLLNPYALIFINNRSWF